MLRALDGAYPLGPRQRHDRGDLPAGPGRHHPADRHAQAQGREDPDRHRAQGPQEARRVARLIRCDTRRILLFTGKGGVGKSTVAAGTAALAAPGRRTLVLSTDAAHSLADAFGAEVGHRADQVAETCSSSRSTPSCASSSPGRRSSGTCSRCSTSAGVDPVAAEELTVIPGAEEVLALLELRLHALSGAWDVIVVDCAPTAETLRLLALPRRSAGTWTASSRPSAGWSRPSGRCSPGRPASRCRATPSSTPRAAARELDEVHAAVRPRGQRAPGAHPRAGRARRGPALVHDAVALRLPRGRGGRQPDLPRRRRRPVARGLGRGAGRGADPGRGVVRRAAALALAVPPGEPVGLDALTDLAREVYGEDDPLRAPRGAGPFLDSSAELATPLFLGLAVLFWLAGFDVIYSLQDHEFDQQEGLHSIPVRFGVVRALQLSSFFHLCTLIFLALVGVTAEMGLIYWLGLLTVSVILFWEHRIVRPNDLSNMILKLKSTLFIIFLLKLTCDDYEYLSS